jgi:hypothetical protein
MGGGQPSRTRTSGLRRRPSVEATRAKTGGDSWAPSDVVDLRRDAEPDDLPTPDVDSPKRRSILAGLTLLAIGTAVGWLVASPGGVPASDPAPAVEAPTAIATGAIDAGSITEPSAGTGVPSTTEPSSPGPAIEPAEPPARTRTLAAGVRPLQDIGQLAGPFTLVPGLEVSVLVRLEPDRTVTVTIPEKTQIGGGADEEPPYFGVPLANVADGVLYAPSTGGLGAVAYWRSLIGSSIPLPDAPRTTSYLAATGDIGIFLSEGEVVVRDLAQSVDIMRVAAHIDGSPAVQVCANDDGTALALVARTGQSVVLDVRTGVTLQEFTSSTVLRGVAWAAPHQLVYLSDDPGTAGQVVRSLDVTTGSTYRIAQLDPSSEWKLSTAGPSC